MKQHLQGMTRAAREHLDEGQYWNLNGKAAVEARHISETLIPASINALASDGKDDPEEAWTSFALNLKTTYVRPGLNPDPAILNRARGGDFEREAPSSGTVVSMLVLFWMSAIFELFVFALQGLYGGSFNPVLLLFAAMLGTGGFLVGLGLGQILYRRWCVSYLKESNEPAKMHVANIALGAILIFGVASIRALGAGEMQAGMLVFIITVMLGAVCALFETLYVSLRNKRERLLLLQGQAQEWVADTAHEHRFEEYRAVYLAGFRRAKQRGGLVDPHVTPTLSPSTTAN